MTDEILFGNLLGLLKTGKWTLSVTEASALLQIATECNKRYEQSKGIRISDPEPIKKPKPKKGDAK